MNKIILPIGSDHRGFELKSRFITWLNEKNYAPLDLGTHSAERCDALDFARKMADEFNAGRTQMGILICGTGQAMAMTSNRYQKIRAALCTSADMARLAREHNDANVLCLGADMISEETAFKCLETFLSTPFLGGRYAERRDALTALGGL